MSETMLIAGMATVVTFFVVLLVVGSRRPGYDPRYHTGSELELDSSGWIQRFNFFLVGSGLVVFAVGVYRVLDSVAGPVLVAISGLSLIVAGLFTPDAVRGYPPGSPLDPRAKPSTHAQIHYASGPLTFLLLLAACLTLASQLHGFWRWYTLATAVAGVYMTSWTILAFQKDAANTGLVQRGLIAVYFLWIVVLGFHLLLGPPV